MQDDAEFDFTAFFLVEYSTVVRTLELMAGDRELAEDVAQDAFAATFSRWRTVARIDRPGAWVRRVAIRMLVRRVRRERRPERLEPSADPAVSVAALDVRRAILTLPPAQRVAVVLYYFEDRSIPECASVMRCAEGTVKTHLYRARQRLAEFLGEEAVEDAL